MKRKPSPGDRERALLRALPGWEENDPAAQREVEALLEQDPQFAATFERMRRVWDDLELPPPGEPPVGFASRVAAEARTRAEGGELRWSAAPRWAKASAVAALLLGALGGASLGLLEPAPTTSDSLADHATLADAYWLVLEEVPGNEGSRR